MSTQFPPSNITLSTRLLAAIDHIQSMKFFSHRSLIIFASLLLATVGLCQSNSPYESESTPTRVGEIDRLVERELSKRGIETAMPASEEVFFRRAYLDITGTIPLPQAYRKYLKINPERRREVLIEALMETEAFDDYWTLKWSDLLRIKAEFPINLWPNGVQAYYRWIREAVVVNMPYDEFARHLLTSSGSNFRVPAVNFYRAIEGQKPETIASAVSLTLMGVRFSSWSAGQQSEMANTFSRVAFKKTDEWKEEIVFLDPGQYSPLDITFPDGTKVAIPAGEDPRDAFADWLIRPDNPWFARNIVNRAWFWLMGRGLIHEPDDIRPDNPSVNPALLTYLEKEFIESGYDIKHVFRLILNSRTYQQSSIPQSDHPEATSLFAHYMVRRLDAEVLFDALTILGGQGEIYQSPVPEPFTFVPEYITVPSGCRMAASLPSSLKSLAARHVIRAWSWNVTMNSRWTRVCTCSIPVKYRSESATVGGFVQSPGRQNGAREKVLKTCTGLSFRASQPNRN